MVMGVNYHLVSEMPNVLDRVASFRVVGEDRSREFFSRIHTPEFRDLGSGLFRFTTELQLSFLDLSLDQFVEGSNVGKLFDPPPCLVMLNSRSETR